VPINFVDLAVKPIAPTELRRFTARNGTREVLDDTSRAFLDAGLTYMRLGDDDIFDRLLADQRLIKLPLVRIGSAVAVGPDERSWKEMLAAAR
jgi:arsenate reductase-like glutaredoxin family protein